MVSLTALVGVLGLLAPIVAAQDTGVAADPKSGNKPMEDAAVVASSQAATASAQAASLMPGQSAARVASSASAPASSDSAASSTTASSSSTASEPEGTLHHVKLTYTLDPNSPMFPLAWAGGAAASQAASVTNGSPSGAASSATEGSQAAQATAPMAMGAGSDVNTAPTQQEKPTRRGLARRQGHEMPGHETAPTPPSTGNDAFLQFLGTGISVKGSPNVASPNNISYTLDDRPTVTGPPPEPNVLAAAEGLATTMLHKLAFLGQQPLVSGVEIFTEVEVAMDVADIGAMKCEKVDLAQNGNVTSDDRISFSGTTKIEDGMVVLDAGASFAVKFRDNTTLVKVHGAVDPAYGAYDAFITMDMSGMSGMDMGMPDMSANEGFGKITGSAKRNTKSKGGLYYISTVVPNYPGHGVKVVAQGQIALVDVELCMSTADGKSAAGSGSTSAGKKSNLGPIIGGAVGGAVFLVLLGGLFFFCNRRKKSRQEPSYRSVSAFTGSTALEAGEMSQVRGTGVTNGQDVHDTRETPTTDLSATSSRSRDLGSPSPGSGAPLLGVPAASVGKSGSPARVRSGPRKQPMAGEVQMDVDTGDVLPTYNHGWTSTAKGDVKEKEPAVRGFIPRRASQVSLATTISTIDDDEDDDEDNDERNDMQLRVDKPSRATSSKRPGKWV